MKKMKIPNSKIKWWMILDGTPITATKTRKLARETAKDIKTENEPKYRYIGKVITKGNHRYLVIDFGDVCPDVIS